MLQTPVRHMTLAQYEEHVAPLFIELKKIIRKKFLMSKDYYGFEFLTHSEYIETKVSEAKGDGSYSIEFSRDFQRGYAAKELERAGVKSTPMPTELYNRNKEIFEILKPLHIKVRNVDFSKVHRTHKQEVRAAIESDVYLKELKSGELCFTTLEAVAESVGVRIPKRLLELKSATSGNAYERKEYVRRSKEFCESVHASLNDYKLDRQNDCTEHLDKLLADFKGSNLSFLDFSQENRIGGFFHMNLRRLVTGNGVVLPQAECDELIMKAGIEYANSFVDTFVERLEEKLSLLNDKWGIPLIEINARKYSSVQVDTTFALTYTNGKVITGDSKIITAGGEVQSRHYRYIFGLYLDGTRVDLEEIDNLK